MIRDRKRIVWVLVALMMMTPSLSVAQQPPKAVPAKKIDASYITPNAIVALVAHPRRVLTAPEWEMLPIEVLSAAGRQELGLDPVDIEQLLAIAEAPQQGPPDYGFVIRLAKPYQLQSLKLPPSLRLEDAQLEGRLYRRSPDPSGPGFFMPDDRTLVIATDAGLKKMLANHKQPVPGRLSKLIGASDDSSDLLVIATIEPIRPMLSDQLASIPFPPPLQGLKRLPELIDAAKADLSVTGTTGASLVLVSPSEADAKELEQLLNQLLEMGRQLALSEVSPRVHGDDAISQATAQYTQRVTSRIIDMLRPERNGKTLRISHDGAGGAQVATVGVLAALLLPAVQAAREAARRTSSSNNLKMIVLAMHNHHDTYRKLPARANFDEDGKPLLSWRVHLLPFLEQAELYEQFHLDEPWDSDHNKTLIDLMPSVYRNPTSNAPPNVSNYVLPTGPGAIFEGQEATSFANITDGTSNTILVLEVDDDASVVWTKPSDFDYEQDNPLAGLGGAHPGGFNIALADGSVRFVAATIEPAIFLRLLMMADGEPTGF